MMMVDPGNASELGLIASEVGAEVLEGDLTYPSDSGGWQLGEIDLSEYLARFKDKKIMLIIAAIDEANADTFVCGICGFVMNELGECPRCKLHNAETATELQHRALFDEVKRLLDKDDLCDGG